MKQEHASSANLIFKTSVYEDKIYVREQKGFFQSIRRRLSIFLMLLFVALPMLRFQGEQAIYFDVGQQKLNFFAVTLFPSDLFIFTILFVLAAFALFYVTKLYGRVWCGFMCPQTVWSLLFSWVERRIEGSHNHSRALDKQPMSLQKAAKKGAKHLIWGAIALFTALVFMSYFVPIEDLYINFFTLQTSSLIDAWVWFFAACTYLNAGWMREKMCEHVCPYARFQSVMFDKGTLIVAYDEKRGEGRGKRKIKQAKSEGQGDCVDCDLCVQVCPVGIDIRDGLQYECISCGLCIDACDQTMDKFNYPKRLIDFKPEVKTQRPLSSHLGYGAAIFICMLTAVVWWQQRIDFDLTVSRDRQALSRINVEGEIENSYLLHIRNKSREQKEYLIAVSGLTNARVIGQTKVNVLPGEQLIHTVAVASNDNFKSKRADIQIEVQEHNTDKRKIQDSSFYTF